MDRGSCLRRNDGKGTFVVRCDSPERGRTCMEDSGAETAARLEEIHGLFQDAVADNPSLSLLRGFKVDFSGNQDFHKIYLAARCDCGTAALLSVEVAMVKTLPEVREAMPSLMENLGMKARQFSNMSCEMHARMRQGGL